MRMLLLQNGHTVVTPLAALVGGGSDSLVVEGSSTFVSTNAFLPWHRGYIWGR